MKPETKSTIEMILRADATVNEETRREILRTCSKIQHRRRLISSEEACQILGVSYPVLSRLCTEGHIERIKYSQRKFRYDANTVEEVANKGLNI